MRLFDARVARHLAVLLLAAASLCRADQVLLDNGDRVTGTVKGLAGGKLTIETAYAGTIQIDVAHIASLHADGEMTVVLEDETRLYGRVSGDAHQLAVAD